MNNNKQTGKKSGTVIRATKLTELRKAKISEFIQIKGACPVHRGITECAKWMAELLIYLDDSALDIGDLERWVNTHSWISDQNHTQLARCNRKFGSPRSSSTGCSHPRSTISRRHKLPSMRYNRQMASAVTQNISHTHSGPSTSCSDFMDQQNSEETDPLALEAVNNPIPSTSSAAPSTSQHFFLEAPETSEIHMVGNGNPQQWPQFVDGQDTNFVGSQSGFYAHPRQGVHAPTIPIQQGPGNYQPQQMLNIASPIFDLTLGFGHLDALSRIFMGRQLERGQLHIRRMRKILQDELAGVTGMSHSHTYKNRKGSTGKMETAGQGNTDDEDEIDLTRD